MSPTPTKIVCPQQFTAFRGPVDGPCLHEPTSVYVSRLRKQSLSIPCTSDGFERLYLTTVLYKEYYTGYKTFHT
jgi:hypothetical protein